MEKRFRSVKDVVAERNRLLKRSEELGNAISNDWKNWKESLTFLQKILEWKNNISKNRKESPVTSIIAEGLIAMTGKTAMMAGARLFRKIFKKSSG